MDPREDPGHEGPEPPPPPTALTRLRTLARVLAVRAEEVSDADLRMKRGGPKTHEELNRIWHDRYTSHLSLFAYANEAEEIAAQLEAAGHEIARLLTYGAE